jgi:2-methylcitrate dehydratase
MLKRVEVSPKQEYSDRFPEEMPVKLTVHLKDGHTFQLEKRDYEGFHTRPMSWETIIQKFKRLADPYTSIDLREKIISTVQSFEEHSLSDLMKLLSKVERPS